MDTENDSTVQIKEAKILFSKERFSVMKKVENDLKECDLQNDEKKNYIVPKHDSKLDAYTPVPTNENIEIPVSKSKSICNNRSLIYLRTAQFLWFASGSFVGYFFSLVLIHRGLTLKDFSFVFPIIILFQILVAYISGIVADKLGNSKPVLLFLMLITILSIISLLLSPRINEKSCVEHNINETCLHILNETSDLEYCKYFCTKNNTNHLILEDVNNYRNDSFTFAKETGVQGNTKIIQPVFNSNETGISSCNDSCFCFNISASNCFSAHSDGLRLLYAGLIWCFFSFWSSSYRFIDFASLTLAKKYNSNFGRERGFGLFGVFVAVVLCNFLLNIDKSKSNGFYDNVFWFSAVGFILSLISTCFISEVLSPPGIKLTKKTLKLFTDIEFMLLFLIAFVTGSAYYFNIFYHLLFLDSLKASKTLLGLHILTSSVYSFPFYLTSKYWLRKLGRKKIVILSLLSYTINASCYSFLYIPWFTLIIEVTKVFCFHLFWISTVTYSNEIAPEGLAATVNSIVGTIHFGLGRSFSVSIGGYIMRVFGMRTAYRFLAGFCLVTTILYITFEYIRDLCSKKDSKDKSKDPEEMKSMREDEA